MNKENGQVALIVLLISAVILTFGLSISRRTVSDTKVDTDQELLKQAFNTAESGVDYYLSTGKTTYISPDNKSQADVTVSQIGGGNSVDYGGLVLGGTNANMWLAGHDMTTGRLDLTTYYAGQNIRLCVDSTFTGALKVDLFYSVGGVISVEHYGYNFGAGIVSNFTDLGSVQGTCPGGMKGVDQVVSAGSEIPILLNIVPLPTTRGTNITIVGTSAIPPQGTEINSLGKSGDITSPMAISRKVRVFKRFQLPQFMFDGITSGGSVTGN